MSKAAPDPKISRNRALRYCLAGLNGTFTMIDNYKLNFYKIILTIEKNNLNIK